MRWDFARDPRLLRDVVTATHRLAELPMFSDDGLTQLLDRHPRAAARVTTMGYDPTHPSDLRTGLLGPADGSRWSGSEFLAMIRRGRLCVTLHNVVDHHRHFGHLVERLCQEMMECQPGLRTGSHNGDLVIASPHTLTYFRLDADPTVFWQIHGSRWVSIYPKQRPFMNAATIEDQIASNSQSTIYFEPEFDNHAEIIELSSGGVLAPPQHTPYRIIGGDSLCVSLVTHYKTRDTQWLNQTHRANRYLRGYFGFEGTSVEVNGIKPVLKRLIGNIVHRKRSAALSRKAGASFCIDPHAPQCVGSLDSDTSQTPMTCPIFPSLAIETPPTVTPTREI